MTRNEFIEDVNYWEDLLSFAYDIEYYFDDIYDSEEFDEFVCNEIVEQTRSWRWQEIRDYLDNLPNAEYYHMSTTDGIEDADYYFDDYKNEVLDYCDEHGVWGEDEDEEEQVEEPLEESEDSPFEIEDEDMLVEMFSASSHEVSMVFKQRESREYEESITEETEFEEFIAETGMR